MRFIISLIIAMSVYYGVAYLVADVWKLNGLICAFIGLVMLFVCCFVFDGLTMLLKIKPKWMSR